MTFSLEVVQNQYYKLQALVDSCPQSTTASDCRRETGGDTSRIWRRYVHTLKRRRWASTQLRDPLIFRRLCWTAQQTRVMSSVNKIIHVALTSQCLSLYTKRTRLFINVLAIISPYRCGQQEENTSTLTDATDIRKIPSWLNASLKNRTY